MAIRHWHPLKIGLIWGTYILVELFLYAFVHPDDFALLLAPILFIPVFIISWRWATGLGKTPYLSPPKRLVAKSRETSTPGVGGEKQYRVFTIQLPRSLVEEGFEFPPKIPDRYVSPGETPYGEIVKEIESEVEGWNLLSLVPLAKESDQEQLTVMALMERPFSEELKSFYSSKFHNHKNPSSEEDPSVVNPRPLQPRPTSFILESSGILSWLASVFSTALFFLFIAIIALLWMGVITAEKWVLKGWLPEHYLTFGLLSAGTFAFLLVALLVLEWIEYR